MASGSRRRIVSEEPEDAASEMDMSVQVESEDQEDMVANTPSKRRTRAMRIIDDDEESAGEEEEEEADEEEEDAEGSEADELESDQESELPIPAASKIKIKLKLPQLSASVASSRRTSRDEDEEDEIESEDSDSVDPSTRSASVVGGRTLTARQAVLANVVDPTHVSLNQPASGRKKPLTALEIALKREETARKRKNLTEKKLEDEKAETINRLLKKQSRSKTKRNAAPQADTPLEGDAEDVVEIPPIQVIPTMYRWISTSRPRPLIEEVDEMKVDNEAERTMSLSFSVPFIALPQTGSAT